MHYILFYDYVENIIERRTPFRQAHLALTEEYVRRGELLLGGAYADPADGAALIFKTEDRSRVESFVANDPYVRNRLVTGWRIREWTVVVGSTLA